MHPFLTRLFIRLIQLGGFFVLLAIMSAAHPTLERKIWGLRNFDFGGTNMRLTEFADQCNSGSEFDFIFIGSSTTYRSVNTEILADKGITSFNMGSSQQPLGNSTRLAQWIIRKGCSPDVFFLDLNASALASDGFESTLDFIMANNQALDREFGLMAWDRQDPYTGLTWLFYGLFRSLSPTPLSPPDKGIYTTGGFIYSTREPAKAFKCRDTPSIHTLSESNIRGVQQLRDIVEQTGSELKFIIPPSPCDIQWGLPADISVHVVNGNEWPSAKVDTMYYDDVHLRGSAANAYSTWLAERLNQAHH